MTEFFADGKISGEGLLENGQRKGNWIFYYRNRQVKAKVSYLNSELNLECQWWHENGQLLQKGEFSSGLQIGFWQRFYDNGQLWDEGHYSNGKKTGLWRVYTKTGQLKLEKTFKGA